MLPRPPHRLIIKATLPLLSKTNKDFIIAMTIAGKSPMQLATNIVTIFENPGLNPGGIIGKMSNKPSMNEIDIAKAQKIEIKQRV